jgi:hypothetical protein
MIRSKYARFFNLFLIAVCYTQAMDENGKKKSVWRFSREFPELNQLLEKDARDGGFETQAQQDERRARRDAYEQRVNSPEVARTYEKGTPSDWEMSSTDLYFIGKALEGRAGHLVFNQVQLRRGAREGTEHREKEERDGKQQK